MENILIQVVSMETNAKHVQEILGPCLVFVTPVAQRCEMRLYRAEPPVEST